MDLNVEQTVNSRTSSVDDENEFVEKISLDIFKAENEKVLKQKVLF